MNIVPLLAPLFLAFELWQLVMCERYMGIKQIARGANPREMGPGEAVSFLWCAGIFAYITWTLALFAVPMARACALALVVATLVAYPIRRSCSLKLILVVLTFEGAVRIFVLSMLSYLAFRHL